MLTQPSSDLDSVAGEIERLRATADLYFQAGLSGLIAVLGRVIVDQAMHLYDQRVTGGNVVAFGRSVRTTEPPPVG